MRDQRSWGETKKLAEDISLLRIEETALGPREPAGATVAGPAGRRLEQIRYTFKAALHKSPLTIRRSRGEASFGRTWPFRGRRSRSPESITTSRAVLRHSWLWIPALAALGRNDAGEPLCPTRSTCPAVSPSSPAVRRGSGGRSLSGSSIAGQQSRSGTAMWRSRKRLPQN